jgi:hypothetical protein
MAAEQYPDIGALPPVAPPSEAGELPAYGPATTWPRTLGIISIIFGVLGVCKGLLTIAGMPLFLKLMASAEEQKEFLSSPLMQTWKTTRYAYGGLAVVLGAFLLACGIGLVRRRRWSAKGLPGWAGLKVVIEVALVLLDYLMYLKVSQAIRQGILETEAVPATFRGWSVRGTTLNLVVSCGLAVSVLIWFARREIREEIASWR